MTAEFNNGFANFSLHQEEQNADNALSNLSKSFKNKAKHMVTGTVHKAEVVAKGYLQEALRSGAPALASFGAPAAGNEDVVDYEAFRTEDLPFTGNKMVSFRQKLNNISVYGSAVNVEMDGGLELVSINSSIAPKMELSTVAQVSPDRARQKVAEYIHNDIPASALPMLYIYFHNGQWLLVYILKNVVSKRPHLPAEEQPRAERGHHHGGLNFVNVIIDAQSGEVLKESPRTMQAAAGLLPDEYIVPKGNPLQLINEQYNVYTHDLNFGRYDLTSELPGQVVGINGTNWLEAGVHAHVNACIVARFLKEVLLRNGIDNKGMRLVSSVQCIEEDGLKEWFNAAWLSDAQQMVYGQTLRDGSYRSLAASLDVVAHEILHGVTNATSNLEYEMQSGALNESYSDIFGMIVSNLNPKPGSGIRPDEPHTWNWELGEETSGTPFRDFSDPEQYGQPAHMNDYRNLPNDYYHDWGGVHLNSGIHNKAAYNVLMARRENGTYIIPPKEAAVLFYMALMQLANTSGFRDSRRAVLNAAKSLYKNDGEKAIRIRAIEDSFSSAGID